MQTPNSAQLDATNTVASDKNGDGDYDAQENLLVSYDTIVKSVWRTLQRIMPPQPSFITGPCSTCGNSSFLRVPNCAACSFVEFEDDLDRVFRQAKIDSTCDGKE